MILNTLQNWDSWTAWNCHQKSQANWETPLGWGQRTREAQSFSPGSGQWQRDAGVSSRMLSSALFSALCSLVSLSASCHLAKLKVFSLWVALCFLPRKVFMSSSIKTIHLKLTFITDRLLFSRGSWEASSKSEAEKWSCFEGCNWGTAGVAIVQPAAAPLSWCPLIFPC